MILAVILGPTLLAGCDRGGTTVTEGPRIETLSGTLVGGSMRGTDCAWIEEGSGRRIEVFWPDRWRTNFGPLEILDENGALVIKEGDTVTLSGFYGDAGASLCSTERLFNAEKVVSRTESP